MAVQKQEKDLYGFQCLFPQPALHQALTTSLPSTEITLLSHWATLMHLQNAIVATMLCRLYTFFTDVVVLLNYRSSSLLVSDLHLMILAITKADKITIC